MSHFECTTTNYFYFILNTMYVLALRLQIYVIYRFFFSNYQCNFCQNFRGSQNWSDMFEKFLPGQLWAVLSESLIARRTRHGQKSGRGTKYARFFLTNSNAQVAPDASTLSYADSSIFQHHFLGIFFERPEKV